MDKPTEKEFERYYAHQAQTLDSLAMCSCDTCRKVDAHDAGRTAPLKVVGVHLSPDARLTYERYMAVRRDVDSTGGMSAREREELRSYAAELVVYLLRDNPETFPEYAEHRAECARRAKEAGR
jgi:hypothetical protein